MLYLIDNVLLPAEMLVDATTTLIAESNVVASEGNIEYPRAKTEIAREEITAGFLPEAVPDMYALYQCQGTARFFMMDHLVDNEFNDDVLDWTAGGGVTTAQLRKGYSVYDHFSSGLVRVVYRTVIRVNEDDTDSLLTITENGSPAGGWTLGVDGLISKASELSGGTILRAASGKFFKPIRFRDRMDIRQHTSDLNSVQQVQFVSALPPQFDESLT